MSLLFTWCCCLLVYCLLFCLVIGIVWFSLFQVWIILSWQQIAKNSLVLQDNFDAVKFLGKSNYMTIFTEKVIEMNGQFHFVHCLDSSFTTFVVACLLLWSLVTWQFCYSLCSYLGLSVMLFFSQYSVYHAYQCWLHIILFGGLITPSLLAGHLWLPHEDLWLLNSRVLGGD